MTKLTEASVDFARAHIEAFYDSDSFPKRDEYRALWGEWSMVKSHLTQKEVKDLVFEGPRCLPARKARGGYRMVHQLEPLSAVVYTALAHMVAEGVEAKRQPANVVFSYRMKLSSTKYFEEKNYGAFLGRCRELGGKHAYVFKTDISDFYNRIYIHRIHGNIAIADPKLADTATTLEKFLMKLNAKTSSGIPVGPAASIVMAEAVLLDVDQFLTDKGYDWARYVDDICVFHDDPRALAILQEELIQYLYDNHRLSLSQSKTSLRQSGKLLDSLADPDAHGGKTLLELARAVLDYGDSYTKEDIDELVAKYLQANPASPLGDEPAPDENTSEFAAAVRRWDQREQKERQELRDDVLLQMLNESTKGKDLDLGVARYALRKGRILKTPALIGPVLAKISKLRPALPEACLYLKEVTTPERFTEHQDSVRAVFESETFKASKFAKLWLFWYLSSQKALIEDPVLGRKLWSEADVDWQMQAARTAGIAARVRQRKASASALGLWDRRSLLMASPLLPRAEREPWLSSLAPRDFVETVIIEWGKKQMQP
jgi:hypothetical protein